MCVYIFEKIIVCNLYYKVLENVTILVVYISSIIFNFNMCMNMHIKCNNN